MVARKRKENESFKSYRENLKHEGKIEKQRIKKYLVAHKLMQIPDDNLPGKFKDVFIGNTLRYRHQSR